ncbi:MAG TPA: FAD/NAD(P)-binding oxidoreductase [Longimicrobiales bacterium]|nr:FAD/NAD(P)-binding oxidoreductase [Longimicrobiales bacterium]
MTERTLILGGGFGGIATAVTLRELLPEDHEIVVVDRRRRFYMGLRKLWLMVGIEELEPGMRPLEALTARGINVRRGEIGRIEPEAKRAWVDGEPLEADYVVVALGAEPRPEMVPGMIEHAFDLYELESMRSLAAALRTFEGGRILIAIAGLPYKCPPAPYEAAFLLDTRFRERGIRDRVSITLATVQPMLLPNAGAAGAERIAAEFQQRGIESRVGCEVKRFERGRLILADGELPFDLAIAVPPHRPPPVVRASGLTGVGDWVEVYPATLRTRFPDVFAIGDMVHIPIAGGGALPKAGVFAEAHGRVVAAQIAARVRGEPAPPPFDGHGFCYLELGGGQAAMIQGNFFAEPRPDLRIMAGSPEYLAAKRAFETERLQAWFGR